MRLNRRKSTPAAPPREKFDLVGLIFAVALLAHGSASLLEEIAHLVR